jgi:hypothetical protein
MTIDLCEDVFRENQFVRIKAYVNHGSADAAKAERRYEDIGVEDDLHEMARSTSSSDAKPAALAKASDSRHSS